jgi:hypothetical protein
MLRRTVMRVVLVPFLVGAAVPAGAIVLGGGIADKDCRVAWEGADATDGTSQVTCIDGTACDTDGTVDGACRFDVQLCVGVEQDGCRGVALDRLDVAGVPVPAPAVPAPDGTCAEPTQVDVPVGTVAAGTVLAWTGRELRDVDYLNLCCVAQDDPLGAARCAVLVDPAVSGCATVPRRVERVFAAARDRVDRAWAEPARARRLLRKAARKAAKARKTAQKLAKRDPCGNALGLVATHARDVLRAAR